MRQAMVLTVLAACAAGLAAAQPLTVTVMGVTSTQAVLTYVAPEDVACTVEVSESPGLVPLVNDVNPELFSGAEQDRRASSVVLGATRLVVVGRRAAERAQDGRRYSRALQAMTQHYYRVTCGAESASGTFMTSNIPLGNNYSDPLPADAGAAGEYAWPTLDWTNRNASYIDPLSGALTKLVTLPGDAKTEMPGVGVPTALDSTAGTTNWTNPNAALSDSDGGAAATISSDNQSALVLKRANLSILPATHRPDYYIVRIKGWATGTTSEDRSISVCLSIDGMNCHGKTITQALGTAGGQYQLGDKIPVLNSWTEPGERAINYVDMTTRASAVQTSGNTVTWAGGHPFDTRLVQGSKIRLGTNAATVCASGADYTVASVPNGKTLTTVEPTSGETRLCSSNFSILIRKTTASDDTISIQSVNYELGASWQPTWGAGGFMEQCAPAPVWSGGKAGYHCAFGYGLYWVATDGEVRLVSTVWTDYDGSIPDGHTARGCTSGGMLWSTSDPNVFYCSHTDFSTPRRYVLLKGTYTGDNSAMQQAAGAAKGPDTTFVNMTPSSKGQDVLSLAHAFNAAVPTSGMLCRADEAQNDKIHVICNMSESLGQDVMAWVIVFDPTSKPEASAGNCSDYGCVVAVRNTFNSPGCRGCALHASYHSGNDDVIGLSLQDLNGGGAGLGPYESTVESVESEGGCPANAYGSSECVEITVNGPPASPVAGQENLMGDAEPGDVYCMTPGSRCSVGTDSEYMVLVEKKGNLWTLGRQYKLSSLYPKRNMTAGVKLRLTCASNDFWRSTPSGAWWDAAADPAGTQPAAHTVIGHSVYRPYGPRGGHLVIPGYFAGKTDHYACPKWPASKPYFCYMVFSGAPTEFMAAEPTFMTMVPQFAGAFGRGYEGDNNQHVAYAQQDAPDHEKQWFTDYNPFNGGSSSPLFAAVEGSLYKAATSTADGDTLGVASTELGISLDRLKLPTAASCYDRPLVDVSSAAQGDVIGTGAEDAYKYCIARKSGECRASSQPGDVYVNCPGLTNLRCTFHDNDTIGAPDACVANNGVRNNAISQIGRLGENDAVGAMARVVTHGFSSYELNDKFASARPLPDASWVLYRTLNLEGSRGEILMTKLPAFPEADSVNRADFLGIPVMATPPEGLGVDNAVVEFGYAENGDPGQYYCTSRREACVKGNQTGNAYGMASDEVAGQPCAGGCSIEIPAIPQRVVYYRVKYRDASNQVVATSSPYVAVTP